MNNEEEMVAIGRMVTDRKALRQKEAALLDQVARASRAFQSLAGLLANYQGPYSEGFEIRDEMKEFANMERVQSLVNELLITRRELRELQDRLDKVS